MGWRAVFFKFIPKTKNSASVITSSHVCCVCCCSTVIFGAYTVIWHKSVELSYSILFWLDVKCSFLFT